MKIPKKLSSSVVPTTMFVEAVNAGKQGAAMRPSDETHTEPPQVTFRTQNQQNMAFTHANLQKTSNEADLQRKDVFCTYLIWWQNVLVQD